MSEQKPVFKVGDGYVDPNGNPVKADGTPIKTTASTESADTSAQTARIEELEGQVQGLTAERDAAQRAVQEGKIIPEDAIARIAALPRISEEMARGVVDALTAPAQPAQD
jgi:hypothetical protein